MPLKHARLPPKRSKFVAGALADTLQAFIIAAVGAFLLVVAVVSTVAIPETAAPASGERRALVDSDRYEEPAPSVGQENEAGAQPRKDARPAVAALTPTAAPIARATPATSTGPSLVDEIERQLHLMTADDQQGRFGLSLVAHDGTVVGLNEGQEFPLASVAKLYILCAYLDKLASSGTVPDDDDMTFMQSMIVVSDNRAATKLWDLIEGTEGLTRFLDLHDLAPLSTPASDEWGSLRASPAHVSGLIAMLLDGQLLDQASTEIALSLMGRVTEDQRWGVSAGLPANSVAAAIKDGWYPDEEGWSINSSGIVVTPSGQYVLVILSEGAPGFREGIDNLESLARAVNAFMTLDGAAQDP